MNIEYVLQIYSFGHWKTVRRTVDISKIIGLLDDTKARFGSEMRVLQSEVSREGERLWYRLKDTYLQQLRDEIIARAGEAGLTGATAEAAESTGSALS